MTDLNFTGALITNTVPPQSITLYVIPGANIANAPHLRMGNSTPGTLDFWVDGQSGQKYAVFGTTNFLNWVAVQTNTLASSSWHLNLPMTNNLRFYRAQWLP